ncbi:hypothetical protein M3Y95_00132800 [Aphelenchoides besseyi]|nr:hypothetical protein M3Y95_00132800 [Aphelenchoides besseyi]
MSIKSQPQPEDDVNLPSYMRPLKRTTRRGNQPPAEPTKVAPSEEPRARPQLPPLPLQKSTETRRFATPPPQPLHSNVLTSMPSSQSLDTMADVQKPINEFVPPTQNQIENCKVTSEQSNTEVNNNNVQFQPPSITTPPIAIPLVQAKKNGTNEKEARKSKRRQLATP